jgi:predicted metalloendopeptidase
MGSQATSGSSAHAQREDKMAARARSPVVQTDPHSPPWWRVNGPLSNMPQFQQAFHCKAGDAMVAGESTRVTIW